jgi:predicted RNase H-like nuclease
LVGVDGCRGGWLAVIDSDGASLEARVFARFADLCAAVPRRAWIGVDMPIGLAERSPRACEAAARQLLGRPRASSVFDVPPRVCLQAQSYSEACTRRERWEGKRLSRQAWGIVPKIAELDEVLRTDPWRARRVVEIHPEVAFAVWAGRPLRHAKRTPAGARERQRLIARCWQRVLPRLRGQLRGSRYAGDDLLDALAVLRSLRRVVAGTAITLGDPQARDAHGLRMCIRA